MGASVVPPSEVVFSKAKRWEIADQLSRILLSTWFRASPRCSTLLRHAVETTVHGQADRLKERQIAIEVFHRKPAYDNSSDPVVRVAAGEVRKRLAQYYGDPENAGQLRITLPVGAYVPVFHFTEEVQSRVAALDDNVPSATSGAAGDLAGLGADTAGLRGLTKPSRVLDSQAGSRSLRVWLLVSAILLVLTVIAAWRISIGSHRSSGFEAFWQPILNSQDNLLVSVGALQSRDLTFVPDPQRNRNPDGSEAKLNIDSSKSTTVDSFGDLQAVARIAAVLGASHKPFDVRDQFGTSFGDFRRPMILVGSFDNDWATGVSAGRRFQLKVDYVRKMEWIEDIHKPGVRLGTLDLSAPEPPTREVYSIVMREFGQVTREPRILIAGIGDKGTLEAAEFACNPRYLNEFMQHAPKDLANKSVEFLLKTRVIENVAGVPTIVDYAVW